MKKTLCLLVPVLLIAGCKKEKLSEPKTKTEPADEIRIMVYAAHDGDTTQTATVRLTLK